MSDSDKAAAAKARGNQHFQKGEFKQAVEAYTEAITFNPKEHTLYSNRSGSYASLGQYAEALKDGEECVKLAPTFVKGYSRKGLALFHLQKLDEAKACYEEGLKVDPNDEKLKEGLDETNTKLAAAKNPLGQLFGDQMWMKLQMDPVTREYLKDPAFVNKLKLMQRNPQMMNALSGDKDPRMMQALGVIMGIGAQFGRGSEDGDTPMEDGEEPKPKKSKPDGDVEIQEEDENNKDEEDEKPKETKKPKEQEKEKPKPKAPEPDLSDEEKEARRKRAEATKEKDAGNKEYKQRNFDQALIHYNKAAELDPKDMIYTTNAAAALFESKKYDQCIETCLKSIETGRENKADGKALAKAYLRLGNAYVKQDKLAEAVEAYNHGLLEDYNDQLKTALKKTQAVKKKKDDLAYLDPAKGEEHKQKGNKFYEEGKWTDAIGEYTESLRRDPKNYKIFSNRAACFTKLMDWGSALEDIDTCLKIDPTFVKAYIRKGKIQQYLKQYHKALETYDKGLALDPEASELMEGKRATLRAINEENATGQVDPARRAEAMKDPEIQAILRDPMINKVLSDMQADPANAQDALKDPQIMAKLEKLINAGVLQARSA